MDWLAPSCMKANIWLQVPDIARQATKESARASYIGRRMMTNQTKHTAIIAIKYQTSNGIFFPPSLIPYARPSSLRFTQLEGTWPLRASITLRALVISRFRWASAVYPPMCGVSMTFLQAR